MNRLFTTFSLLIITIAAFAQERAAIEVGYRATEPNMKTGKINRPNKFILLAGASESKFYSPMTEYLDSLQSTPEGEAKYKEMARGAFMSGKQDKIPRPDGSYYVVKSVNDNTMKTFDINGMEKYLIEEPVPQCAWEIADSTKTILGYECQMATADFHGRTWTAWFTPEIPVTNGPWKLGGLPGLILEAVDDSGLYTFEATGLQQSSRSIIPVYSSDAYDPVDRKEFLKMKRKMIDNTISEINAQLSGLGISIASISPITPNKSRKELDLIETDY